MSPAEYRQSTYRALAKAIFLALGLYLLLGFLDTITLILLFFMLAMIISIALTPPVNWLESKGMPRWVAAILVLTGVLGVFVGLGWLVVPRISTQTAELFQDLPALVEGFRVRFGNLLERFPGVSDQLAREDLLQQALPSLTSVLSRVGSYTVTLVTLVLAFLVLLATVGYTLAEPRRLLRGIVTFVPDNFREAFMRAYARGANTVVRWVWANAIIGFIEAVAAVIFFTWVVPLPGAWLWATIIVFAELIPQIGSYLMAIPPLILALTIDPTKALWVLLFYIGIQQFVNNFLAPQIRAREMHIHPVSEIFTVLALGYAFGILGALIADPLIGFAKAFFDEFYVPKNPPPEDLDGKVELVLHGDEEALGVQQEQGA